MGYDERFTDEHRLFRKTVREFFEREVAPHALEWELEGTFPREIFTKAGALGLFGINKRVDVGGSALDYWYTVAYAEELVRCRSGGVATALMVQSDMATPILDAIGSEALRAEFLAPAITGEKIAALGVTEPGAGSDVAALRTVARRDGDDYVISGQKTFISNGARADFVVTAVRTGGEGHKGISFVVVPTDAPGFSVGAKLEKVGNLASDTAELFFDEVRVPTRYRLGEENQGFALVMSNFEGERLMVALNAVATMALAIEDAVSYGREREIFGRPVVGFQVWRHKLAERLTQIEAARQLTYHAADRFDRGLPATREITMAKLFASDLAQQVLYDAQQLFGGAGYMLEYPIARAWRDVRLLTVGGGTSEVMKEIVARLEGL